MKKTLIYLLIALPLLFNACSNDDEIVQPPVETEKGVVIINEGLFGQNNSSVTYYDLTTGEATQNAYAAANNGADLGDTANDMKIFEGKGYIVVNVSKKLEVVNMSDFSSAGSIDFTDYGDPREVTIISASQGFVTTYNDIVVEFNPSNLSITDTIVVGSKPEGIVYHSGGIFVANSGWGNGSTVTAINVNGKSGASNIEVGVNPRTMLTDENFVYAICSDNYFSPTGREGIYKIDPATLTLVDSIIIGGSPGDAAIGNGKLFVVNATGLVSVDLNSFTIENETLISANDVNSFGFGIYSIGYDKNNELIYLGNPKDFTQNGNVAVFDMSGVEKNRIDAGINPGTILFYVSQ